MHVTDYVYVYVYTRLLFLSLSLYHYCYCRRYIIVTNILRTITTKRILMVIHYLDLPRLDMLHTYCHRITYTRAKYSLRFIDNNIWYARTSDYTSTYK